MLTFLTCYLAFTSFTKADTTETFFLIMADWGGSPNSPYTTSEEVASANIMSKIADDYNITAIAGIGDNFYNDGVKNEYDSRFQTVM